MKKVVSILLGVMSQYPVFAHEPGQQLIGSSIWKGTFFTVVGLFLASLLWSAIITYVKKDWLRQLLLVVLVGLVLTVVGYVGYHYLLETGAAH